MFDAQAIFAQTQANQPTMDRTPIEPGWYKVTINQFERMMNKNGSGEHLKMEFDLENRRKVWNRYNLRNNNPKAESIALEQLAALCISCGYNSISDPWNPVELMGKQCELYIDVDGTYNQVKSVRPIQNQMEAAKKLYSQPAAKAQPAKTPDDDFDSIPF
jgi:hypothetical protein